MFHVNSFPLRVLYFIAQNEPRKSVDLVNFSLVLTRKGLKVSSIIHMKLVVPVYFYIF